MIPIIVIIYIMILMYSFVSYKIRKYCLSIGVILILISGDFLKLSLNIPTLNQAFLSILLGYLSYLGSIFIVSRPIKSYKLYPFTEEVKFNKVEIYNLFRIIVCCIYEEFLWRGIVYVQLGNNAISFILTSLIFTISHFKKVSIMQIFDILIFSIFIGIIFVIFKNIWMCIVIHSMRNALVSNVSKIMCRNQGNKDGR